MGKYVILRIDAGVSSENRYIPAFRGSGKAKKPAEDFYPDDIKKGGKVTLYLAGVDKFEVDGIRDTTGNFLLRSKNDVGEFYRLHGLTKEDSIVIERIEERVYSIYPFRDRQK